MIHKQTYRGITWVDVLRPSHEEVKEIITTYNINPAVAKNMILPSPKSHIYDYHDLLYLVLHFPARKSKSADVRAQEVDFLLGKDFLVTIHFEPVDALEQFAKSFEVTATLGNQDLPHAGFLFFEVLKQLFTTTRDSVAGVEDELAMIEPKVFHDREKEVVRELSLLNRAILEFKRIIDPEHELLELASAYTDRMFGPDFLRIMRLLLAEHAKTSREIQYEKETLSEIWNTNDALLNTKQNEIMKNLTMISFVIFPLSLIVSIFDLYASLSSVDTGTKAFWILMIILIISAFSMILFFKNKKWI